MRIYLIPDHGVTERASVGPEYLLYSPLRIPNLGTEPLDNPHNEHPGIPGLLLLQAIAQCPTVDLCKVQLDFRFPNFVEANRDQDLIENARSSYQE